MNFIRGISLLVSFFVLVNGASAQTAVPYPTEPVDAAAPASVQDHDEETIEPYLGTLRLRNVDMRLPGPGGFDIEVVRAYNSGRMRADADPYTPKPLGWTVHFGRLLVRQRICQGEVQGDTTYMPILEMPDGSRRLVYQVSQAGSPVMLTTDNWSVTCSGGGYVVRSPDGTKYDMQFVQPTGMTTHLTPWGPNDITVSMYATTKITDKNGNFADITYTPYINQTVQGRGRWGEPRIGQLTASDGRTLTFGYTDLGGIDPWDPQYYLTSVTAGTGQRVNYTYLNIGSSVPIHALVGAEDPAGRKWTYQYQLPPPPNANCVRTGTCPVVYGDWLLQSVKSPWGGTRSYTWKAALAGDPGLAGIATKTTSDGGTWSYSYAGNPSQALMTTVVNGPAGQTTFQHWHTDSVQGGYAWLNRPAWWKNGLLRSKQVGNIESTTYDWWGQPINDNWNVLSEGGNAPTMRPVLVSKTTVRDGATHAVVQSNFDKYGNPGTTVETGPNGGSRTTTSTYYTNPSLWIIGELSDQITVGVGATTRTWGANGNLASETHDGVTTSYTYHPSGDVFTVTKPRGLVSTFTNYNRGIPQNEVHPEGVAISRVVSGYGDIVSETNGEGNTKTFLHDGIHRVTRVVPPIGTPTTIAYAANTQTETRGSFQKVTTFDGFGRTTAVSRGGIQSANSFDSLGRRIFGSTLGYPTIGNAYQYDALNRVTRITHNADASYRTFTYSSSGGAPTLAVRDERGYVTTHAYRAYADPDTQYVMNITAPVPAANVTMTRNGRDLVTSVTQDGITRKFNYDTRYYLTSTEHPEVGVTAYGRDDAGNMISRKVGSSGTSTYDYDGRNRLWRITYPNSAGQVINTYFRTDKLKTVSNATAVRTYGYDGNQNLTSETLVVDGQTLGASYEYTGNDYLSAVVYPVLGRRAELYPNALGRPTSISLTPYGSMLATTFWPNGQIYDIAFAGGSRVTYGQNTREWLTSITVKTADNVSRIASTLNYDVAGNMYNATDSADASYNRTFSYDEINRLRAINGPWGTGAVAYTGGGNISSYVVGSDSRSYAYDAQNRLGSVSSTVSGSTSYAYDAYGNASPSTGSYTYDDAGNLVVAGAGRIHGYDGANTRVKTTSNGVTTYEFRSAQGLLLAEWRKQAGYYDVLKEHVFLATKEVAEQQTQFLGSDIKPAGWMFLQPDAVGSPISSTIANGTLFFKQNYQPYGSQLSGASAAYTQRAFAGHTQDKPDLIYMGARYYNPMIGRFLSIDPVEADPSNLHSLNRYAYANNNPNRFVDPDGRNPLSPVDVGFLAVDLARFGFALYTGVGIASTGVDLLVSGLGVVSPVPGLRLLRTTEKVVDGVKTADRVVEAAKTADNVADAAKGVEKTASGKRVGDFTPSQKKAAKAENAAANGGEMKCTDCGKGLQSIKSEKGVKTPSNQAQVHHDPAIQNGGGQHSTPVVVCPDCHADRHLSD